jgi:hypothetical protein
LIGLQVERKQTVPLGQSRNTPCSPTRVKKHITALPAGLSEPECYEFVTLEILQFGELQHLVRQIC